MALLTVLFHARVYCCGSSIGGNLNSTYLYILSISLLHLFFLSYKNIPKKLSLLCTHP